MKENKGFTLIELLAVIIILGILMIIAVPAVTKYINNSRKSTYINNAKNIVSGVRTLANSEKLNMKDEDVTYYIPAKFVKTENDLKSPYGEFTKAYVAVINTGEKYKYYWISTDDTMQGVKNITPIDKLDDNNIEGNITDEMVESKILTTSIGSRGKILVLNPTDGSWNESSEEITNYISESGGEFVCKRATTLHEKTCGFNNANFGCGASVGYGNKIVYGSLVNGKPKPGDAYDCKTTIDGDYTERFYYVKSEGDYSVLIYYKNINNQTVYAYDSSSENWHGPRSGYQYLPSTSDWNNPKIIPQKSRQIKNELGGNITTGGTIENFTYDGKSARLLTYQEVIDACGSGNEQANNYLKNYSYLFENLGLYENGSGAYGYWLETPRASHNTIGWCVSAVSNSISINYVGAEVGYGIRPVITVLSEDILNK